jgi:hypothetical protein
MMHPSGKEILNLNSVRYIIGLLSCYETLQKYGNVGISKAGLL